MLRRGKVKTPSPHFIKLFHEGKNVLAVGRSLRSNREDDPGDLFPF
jgi:hypothetical protein